MRALPILTAASAALCLALAAMAEPQPATLSPATTAALAKLASDNPTTRAEGLQQWQQAISEDLKALIASDDPEAQSRVVRLLQFQDGLTTWTLETLKLPDDQSKAQLDFCLRADVLPKIAGLFQRELDKRAQGLEALAALKDPPAGDMLLRLMEDRDRPVRLAAIAALKGRPATPAMVDALWNSCVEEELLVNNSPFTTKHIKQNQVHNFDNNQAVQACDVLISLHAPQVDDKLLAVLRRAEAYYETGKGQGGGNLWVMDDRQPPLRSVCRLLKAYKPKAAVPILMRIATGKSYQGASMAYNDKNMPLVPMLNPNQRKNNPEAAAAEDAHIKKETKTTIYWSTRTQFIQLFAEVTAQNPEEYKIKRFDPIGGLWTVPSKDDEDNAAAKIKEWWSTHAAEYGESPATQSAETHPAK